MATIRAEIIQNTKKIRIVDLTDYTAYPNARGILVIQDPNGNYIVNNGDFDNPDITVGAPISAEFSLNLVSGVIPEGVFTIIYNVDYNLDDISDDTTNQNFTYSLFDLVSISIEVESSLADTIIQSTDISAYGGTVTLNSRVHSLTDPIDVVSSSSDKDTNTTIALQTLRTGQYEAEITSGITIAVSSEFWIIDSINGTEPHDVWASDGITDLESGIAVLYDRYNTSLATDNGNNTEALETVISQVNMAYALYQINRFSGDVDQAAVYLNDIVELLAAEDITIIEPTSESVPVTRIYPGYAAAWYNDIGVPNPDLGRNGDYFYRQDTGHVYKKASDIWTDIGAIYSNTTVDGVTLEIFSNDIRIKDDGVTGAKLAPAVAGDGLKQDGSGNLDVNVDGSTIEINSDTLRVKDGGITNAKLANDDITITGGSGITSSKEDTILGETTDISVNIDNISVGINGSDQLYSKVNTYIAYADDKFGDGFTEIFDVGKEFTAILKTTTPIETRSASDYDGLWFRTVKYGTSFTYDNIEYFDTNELGAVTNFLVLGMNPSIYQYKGTYNRMYITFFEGRRDAAGNVRGGRENRSWISYYDLDKKTFAEPVTLTELFPNSDDLHNMPQIIVTDSGHIIITKESLSPGGAHNSPLEIWRSDNIEDISAFTKVALLNYELGYTEIYKLTDGTLILNCRERIGGEERYRALFKSEDDGVTWRSMTGVLNTKTQFINYDTAGYFMYTRQMLAKQAQGLNVIGNPDIGVTGYPESVHFLHSDDGITWENARQYVEGSGGFSHNIVDLGAMTRSILDTNFLVDGAIPDPVNNILGSNHGAIDEDGIPYLYSYALSKADTVKSNGMTSIKIFYYDVTTHAWISTEILPKLIRSNDAFGLVLNPYIKLIAYQNGRYDVIVQASKSIGNMLIDDVVINSGVLNVGVYYRVVTTDGSFDAAIGVGDIIRGKAGFVPDANNTVVPVIQCQYVFRTEDYGDSFSYIDLDSKYRGMGALGELNITQNCLDTRQMLLACQTGESTSKTVIEYSNMILYKGQID